MAENKNDFDFSDESLNDPNIKVPGSAEGAKSLAQEQEAEARGDLGNDRDLADKAGKQAMEVNFETGNLEPVADHLSDADRADEAMDPDGDGEADGPDDPHAGNAEQSATDNPKRSTSKSSKK